MTWQTRAILFVGVSIFVWYILTNPAQPSSFDGVAAELNQVYR